MKALIYAVFLRFTFIKNAWFFVLRIESDLGKIFLEPCRMIKRENLFSIREGMSRQFLKFFSRCNGLLRFFISPFLQNRIMVLTVVIPKLLFDPCIQKFQRFDIFYFKPFLRKIFQMPVRRGDCNVPGVVYRKTLKLRKNLS